jgi:hypothetical protein
LKTGVARLGSDSGASRALGLEHLDVLLEADVGIVGPGGRLGVVLDAHRFHRLAQEARACAVVEVDVCHLHVARERFGVDGVVVVLRADLDAACTGNGVSVTWGMWAACHCWRMASGGIDG